MPAQLILLATSPRVAPGLLTQQAWAVLGAADLVLARSGDHPLVGVLPAGRVHELAASPLLGPQSAAAALVEMARASAGSVVYLVDPDGEQELITGLRASAGEEGSDGVVVREVTGSYDVPGARVIDLVRVMDRLRSPGGCPWDAAQTHESLARYLLEESYETVEAIETGDETALREELGDVLLQVAFHARLGAEHAEPWGIDDVAAGVVDKLVRRHPHVFADAYAPTADAVASDWERRKATEKGRTSPAEGVPLAQPALSLASALLERASRAGHDGYGLQDPNGNTGPGLLAAADEVFDNEQALGEALLGVVARARVAGLDPERALRGAARRLADQLRQQTWADPGPRPGGSDDAS
jgi:XTP/dITP diphosphohydrolase